MMILSLSSGTDQTLDLWGLLDKLLLLELVI
jgi:hypothetical protein